MTKQRRLMAKRIRLIRQDRGMSQKDVAATLKVHRVTVTEIESGDRDVSAKDLILLASLFQYTELDQVAWLAGMDC